LNIQNNLPVFATIVEANYISTREDKISFETLTDEDIQEIQRLSKDPKIAQRVKKFFFVYLIFVDLENLDLCKYWTINLWS
jgi:DNA replicative helicase MCM subunit Mcm2 (Cdc46/Mcm family)